MKNNVFYGKIKLADGGRGVPKVLVFAGANGAGKTTLARGVVKPGLKFIDADAIRDEKGLSYVEAGKRTLSEIDECISKGRDFSFESTMSGLALEKRFQCLRRKKYDIIIFYLFVYPLQLLIERIKERIKKGGHFVSDEDIIRRYYRSMANFWYRYRKYAFEWAILNNNEFRYKTVALGNNGITSISDAREFRIFEEMLKVEKRKK